MARHRQIIHGDLGTGIQFYDTLPVKHQLNYWDQHYTHRYWYWTCHGSLAGKLMGVNVPSVKDTPCCCLRDVCMLLKDVDY